MYFRIMKFCMNSDWPISCHWSLSIPLKKKNKRFSDVFRVYRKRTVVWIASLELFQKVTTHLLKKFTTMIFIWADLNKVTFYRLANGNSLYWIYFQTYPWEVALKLHGLEAVAWRCSVKVSQNSQENTFAKVSYLIKL